MESDKCIVIDLLDNNTVENKHALVMIDPFVTVAETKSDSEMSRKLFHKTIIVN